MAPHIGGTIGGGHGERRLTAEYVAARVLLDAPSIEEAATRILRAICENLGWEHGALWLVDREHNCLRSAQNWTSSVAQFPEFIAISDGMTFQRGIGLPGRVWASGQPAWIPDVVADENFPRSPVAAREGLHGAFGFPILLRGEVYGVIEFFSREIREPDEQLLSMLTTVGNQIGMFIERRRAQDDLARFFSLSLDMLCVAGFDGYLKRVNPAWEKTLGYTEAELLARPYMDFVHPDDREATRAEAAKIADGKPVIYFENRYFHKNGSVRWLLWAAAPFVENEVVYAAARDITERKLTEELRARAQNLELLDALLTALVDSGDLRDVFGQISAVAKKVLVHDAAALMVRVSDTHQARMYASSGFPPGLPEILDVPEEILRTPNWDNDILEDLTRLAEPRYAALVNIGFRSLLRVPIRLDGQFAGALIFFAKTQSTFTQGDVLAARRMADRMAVVLARDRELAAAKRADEATARASNLEARVRALTEELDARTGYRRVVGESAQWRHALTQATQVASTEATVLLLGESGTGKEVVARFLHRASAHKNGPFIALNCAALPEQLLEAELFGYERGAFTGAMQSKPGQLEQAAGGTLFLDEVAEMSPSAQAKFLRVLQEREFQRLGGTRVLHADARVIAATNRDLEEAMADGGFREDLFYRLNVFAIRLPALRERRDDIPALSQAFLADIGRGLGTPPAGISRDAQQALAGYDWPGNVRELRNVLERAAILCDGGLITCEHLALTVAPSAAATVPEPVIAPPPATAVSSSNLNALERDMIEHALQAARFNKSKAAKALGLTRTQLYVRMRKHGFH
jgi:PAS domain S-box-containing protein